MINRQTLVKKIKEKFKDKLGVILLVSNFEQERYRFRQESSFYYFTGITEPGVVNTISLDNTSTLFMPNFNQERSKWVDSCVYGKSNKELESLGINKIEPLGSLCAGYAISPCFDIDNYKNLISYLKNIVSKKQVIFTVYKDKRYSEQRLFLERLINYIPELKDSLIDISDLIAQIRRKKSKEEIEKIYKAINITISAQQAAASVISPNKKEYEIQAAIDFIFTDLGASSAFPSIVASGKNSTVLHYNKNNNTIAKDSLVVVDIGAELDYYCADLTRTYPSNGEFNKRQKEIYNIVKDTQEYIASLAQPGYWIKNNEIPEKSLHHLAVEYLKKLGYSQYFTHSIGHYLGLDVHDVGNYTEPLEKGDVITIEPGIYIPEENLGIRIEDNYWILGDKSLSLSEDLVKNTKDIEALMKEGLS